MTPGATADVFMVEHRRGRFVAKYAYDHKDYFETGLRASDVVAGAGWTVAVALRTDQGELTELVEGPDGVAHPLAVLHYVPGDTLDGDRLDAPLILGHVCGGVHALLMDVDAADVGTAGDPPELILDAGHWDLGPNGWLHYLADALNPLIASAMPTLRPTVGVWDGPDIRMDGDQIGLIDFGHTAWHPLVHVVANRSVVAAYQDSARLAAFLAEVEKQLPLTAEEHDALGLFRLVNATIYASWASMKCEEHRADGQPDELAGWLSELVALIRTLAGSLGLRDCLPPDGPA